MKLNGLMSRKVTERFQARNLFNKKHFKFAHFEFKCIPLDTYADAHANAFPNHQKYLQIK